MTNKEDVFRAIQAHPEGLDDDDIAQLTGIQPRQQVQQLCMQLASSKRIRRESVDKAGKRRKIHNFPVDTNGDSESPPVVVTNVGRSEQWRHRLGALVAATGRTETELLEEAIQMLAMKVLNDSSNHNGSRRKKR